jgi:hypothetical protein
MIIALKKSKAANLSDDDTFSHIEYTAKLVVVILRKGIERKIGDVIREDQF